MITGNETLKSAYLAHIIASDPNGPRGHPVFSKKLSNNPDNIMLLCNKHHNLIDSDETKGDYPVELLTKMKYRHEQFIQMLTGVLGKPETHIITYSAQIGYNQVLLSKDHIKDAVIPGHCPRLDQMIRLDQESLPSNLEDENFWELHFTSLRELYRSDVKSRVRRNEIERFTVFAIAPIPLLIELGRLLSDITPTIVRQLHREPNTWVWQNDRRVIDLGLEKLWHADTGHVALSIEISSEIAPDRITAVLGSSISLWRLKVSNPHNDIIRSPDDLARFREFIRQAYERIKTEHGESAILHVFPSVPVSAAVEVGRTWQPKAHLPFHVYDQNRSRGGFVYVSTVNQEGEYD